MTTKRIYRCDFCAATYDDPEKISGMAWRRDGLKLATPSIVEQHFCHRCLLAIGNAADQLKAKMTAEEKSDLQSCAGEIVSWKAEDGYTTTIPSVRVNDDDLRNGKVPWLGSCQLTKTEEAPDKPIMIDDGRCPTCGSKGGHWLHCKELSKATVKAKETPDEEIMADNRPCPKCGRKGRDHYPSCPSTITS